MTTKELRCFIFDANTYDTIGQDPSHLNVLSLFPRDCMYFTDFDKFFVAGACIKLEFYRMKLASNNLCFMQSHFSDEIIAKENHVVHPI